MKRLASLKESIASSSEDSSDSDSESDTIVSTNNGDKFGFSKKRRGV